MWAGCSARELRHLNIFSIKESESRERDDMRFREVGAGYLEKKKLSPEENSLAVEKACCVVLAVSRREVA